MPTGIWLIAYVAVWLLVLVTGVLLVAVIRQLGHLHGYWVKNDPEWGLPLGSLAPALAGQDLKDRPVCLGSEQGRRTLVFFLSTNCYACKMSLNRAPVFAEADNVDVVLVVADGGVKTRLFVGEVERIPGFARVLVLPDPEKRFVDQYKVVQYPYQVVVDQEGRIGAKGGGFTTAELWALIRQSDSLRGRRLNEALAREDAAGGAQRDPVTV